MSEDKNHLIFARVKIAKKKPRGPKAPRLKKLITD
jgi:hypothetical protein